ncbi:MULTISPECIES: mechanosensitive ion channel domain-containing protein [Lysobacteraceae]|uniref:mechanosensitive ion channel domain-containing protein n=1 Tax=Lysobacteraceae TaxID=32033 RepID=UPI001BCD3012|nr:MULTISPECIES: mechanosensitive ion channel domain-containing protein [Lysobacter]
MRDHARPPAAPADRPRRWLAVAAVALCLACAGAAIAQEASKGDLDKRVETLRAELGPPSDSLTEDRPEFLRRLLLASLERRRDVQGAIKDVARLGAAPITVPVPDGVLALDDLRRELQRLDADIAGNTRRRAILVEERAALATQLADRVARLRTLTETGADAQSRTIAALEAQLNESATAETDLMLRLLDVQQSLARRQRDAYAARLRETSTRTLPASARDAATIDARLGARGDALRQRMSAAAKARERTRADWLAIASTATPLQAEAAKERIANADIDLELAREALTNLATEQLAWQFALRFYRDHDAAALIEARRNGPVLLARLQRRHDFLQAFRDQILARSGALGNELAQAPGAPDAADKHALRDVFDARLQMVDRAIFDERQLGQLIDRLRTDFDARAGQTDWRERVRIGWAIVRDGIARAWNFELFSVDQTIEVEGRKTVVPRGVTVGKVIKAPLLLVLGIWLATISTGWAERWLHRRRHVDEGRARLMRRWALAILIAACVLASLAIAGIPFAAFAFIGGAVAIGIGFGMQSLFKNLISGVLVLVERPFRLGDVIEVGGLQGTVVDIDLRTSVVRDGDGAETLIPNSVLMEENVKNVTFRTRRHRQSLAVVVDGDSDPRAVADAMRAAASRHGQLADDPEPVVLLEDFADNGLRFALHYWIDLVPAVDRRRIASDLRLMVLGAFEDAGIRLAPPPRTVA